MATVTDEYWRRIRPAGWTHDISVAFDEIDPPFPEERTARATEADLRAAVESLAERNEK